MDVVEVSESKVCDCLCFGLVERRVELVSDFPFFRETMGYYFTISEQFLLVYVVELSFVVRISFDGVDGMPLRKHLTHVQLAIGSAYRLGSRHDDWRLLVLWSLGRRQEEVFDVEHLVLVHLVPVPHVVMHHRFAEMTQRVFHVG